MNKNNRKLQTQYKCIKLKTRYKCIKAIWQYMLHIPPTKVLKGFGKKRSGIWAKSNNG